MTEKELALFTVKTVDEKKAENIVALQMEGISLVADYFVICHGQSVKQVQALARALKDSADEADIEIKRIEGMQEGRWVLIDLNDVIVHIFHKAERDHYQLEKLWGDAPTLDLQDVLT